MNFSFNPASLRIVKARAHLAIGNSVTGLSLVLMVLFLGVGVMLLLFHRHQGLILLGIGEGMMVLYIWVTRDLGQLQSA